MSRLGRVRGRRPAGLHPFRVDLIPPPDGFDAVVEADIILFLERRAGTFDIFGEIATGGEFLRYCFARHADAEAFRRAFAPVAEKAILHEFFPKPERI